MRRGVAMRVGVLAALAGGGGAFVGPSSSSVVVPTTRTTTSLALKERSLVLLRRATEEEAEDEGGGKNYLYPRPRRRRPERYGVADSFRGVALTSLIVALVSFGNTNEALASYAPSGAAVTSSVPARTLNLDDFESLSRKKALQRERALAGTPLSDLLSQLDDRLDELQNQVRDIDAESSALDLEAAEAAIAERTGELFGDVKRKVEEQATARQTRRDEIKRELEQKRTFEAELRKRAKLLKVLEEQPSWFNYAAAAGGSIVSTVAMHPVDTVKTRLQAAKMLDNNGKKKHKADDDDDDDDVTVVTTSPPLWQATNGASGANGAANGASSSSSSKSNGHSATTTEATTTEATTTTESTTTEAPFVPSYGGSPGITTTSDGAYEYELQSTAVAARETYTLDIVPQQEEELVVQGEEDDGGIASLYAGVSGNVAKEALPSALYLGVYEAVKASLLKTPAGATMPLLVYLLAGGVGELCGSFFRAPAEAVKSLTQAGVAATFPDAVSYIAATPESRARVVRAWTGSVLRDVPMGAIQISIFEGLKVYILNAPGISIDVNTLAAEAALGSLGGLIGALVTTPFDVATTRIITATDDDSRDVFQVMKEIVDEEGPLALFDGSLQRGLYWAPAIGLFLSCYCSIRQFGAFNPVAHDAIQQLSQNFLHFS
mmetsp:Transcript_20781/g.64198  ORF Transcript_20781/g.64198 Transcript_20781/m.64198 type:complete len:663 (+) Transcript_20781:107-2095(+)|eukprot:CAMPEP_0198645238 /NCGR_PEP_ID=MMETSP1467-20131203/1141_1 /TAXON_ID=1462469 /ORGANISM="unid. sp., Strain CCMP2135" /LENGTH=662 /DNA_ID=CAMNT_0044380725 /DNA_START=75 /DNA_END=2063 /DNA_ORIENTATION=-